MVIYISIIVVVVATVCEGRTRAVTVYAVIICIVFVTPYNSVTQELYRADIRSLQPRCMLLLLFFYYYVIT